MKILGIDFGTKRVGLAISDETAQFARELAIWSPEQFWTEIQSLIDSETIEVIVVGLPLNMSGEDSEKTEEARTFAERLKQTVHVPIELVDERLTSQMAEQIAGTSKNIDSLAAQIFLQTYLDNHKSHEPV